MGETMTNNTNLLQQETSPYLLQHKDNPVHWWPWCDEAFEQAKTENKPVLLSVGYAACHWCHVMAHESFEDKKIASLMNKLFINIKVDREERPDIDAVYQKALQTMGEAGGWPLTMVLTPDGKPFFGGTYFPPITSHGRPAFSIMLEKISQAFVEKPELIKENSDKIIAHLEKINTPRHNKDAQNLSIKLVAEKLLKIMDDEHGGTNGAPKFPQTAMLNMLWWGYQLSGEEKYKDAVYLAMRRMSLGGIYDHVGGGYSRYSTDPFWFAPHFEKMLYDNAYILELLSLCYLSSGDVFWQRRASESVAWLMREMQIGDGGFASAIDADSEGREGAFYVWQESEIKKILNKDADLFIKTFGVTKQGNWKQGLEGENILHLLHLKNPLNDADEGKLKKPKKILLAEREKRPRPLTDNKILCDWNGAMISGLVVASRVFNKPAWLQAAINCYGFIKLNISQDDDRLVHSFCEDKQGATGLLEDYAQMSRAALSLYEHSGEVKYLTDAEQWTGHVLTYFKTEHGGFLQKASYDTALIVKTCDAQDGALPSGNAIILEVLAKLYHLTGVKSYYDVGLKLYHAFTTEIAKHPLSYVSLIQAKALLDDGLLITVIGSRKDKNTLSFLEKIYSNQMPNKIVQIISSFDNLPENHPAQIKKEINGVCVIMCENGRCSLPAYSLAEVTGQLKTFPTMKKKL
jgi:hypothetical protein